MENYFLKYFVSAPRHPDTSSWLSPLLESIALSAVLPSRAKTHQRLGQLKLCIENPPSVGIFTGPLGWRRVESDITWIIPCSTSSHFLLSLSLSPSPHPHTLFSSANRCLSSANRKGFCPFQNPRSQGFFELGLHCLLLFKSTWNGFWVCVFVWDCYKLLTSGTKLT